MSEVLPNMEELLKRAEEKGRADAIDEIRDKMTFIPKGEGVYAYMTFKCWNEIFAIGKEQKNEVGKLE